MALALLKLASLSFFNYFKFILKRLFYLIINLDDILIGNKRMGKFKRSPLNLSFFV